jgi:hypothetical protein
MRRFHSYGPVDPEQHFCVPRSGLVEECVGRLVGVPDKGGHHLTLWAPQQSGKTWLMRRAIEEIRARHGDGFIVGSFSMGGTAMRDDEPEEAFLNRAPRFFDLGFRRRIAPPSACPT